MENLENKALNSYRIAPRLYIRYVDDLFLIWDSLQGDYRDFLAHLNNQNKAIKLTVEEESKEGTLPFLDILVQRPVVSPKKDLCKAYSISVYRKPTNSHRYLHFRSAVPKSLKKNTLRGTWLKAQRLLKRHPESLREELKYMRNAFTSARNAYPRKVIDNWLANFQTELNANPEILRLPNKTERKKPKPTPDESQALSTCKNKKDERNGRIEE